MSKILGVKIDELSKDQVLAKIGQFLKSNSLHQITTINPEFMLAAQKDSEFKKVLNDADLSVPDGVGLKLAGFIKRQKIGERITGVDLTWELAKIASQNDYSIFFLGAKEGIAKKAASILKLKYPNLKIAGTYAGSPSEEGIAKKINDAHADILLVAFGAPKQDKFIYNNKNTLNVKIAIGVGGTFDYIAGIIPRAPKWMRSFGLEWLYRLFRQPSRLGRIFNAVIKFPILVICSRTKH